MEFDEIKIDPSIIEFTRALIQRYVANQKSVLGECRTKIRSLSQSWDDEPGFGALEKSVSLFVSNSIKELDQINNVYGRFLYDEALDIRKNLAAISKK